MKRKHKETEKLYWRSLPRNCRLRYDAGSFWLDNALIYWLNDEAIEAQMFLKTRVRI